MPTGFRGTDVSGERLFLLLSVASTACLLALVVLHTRLYQSSVAYFAYHSLKQDRLWPAGDAKAKKKEESSDVMFLLADLNRKDQLEIDKSDDSHQIASSELMQLQRSKPKKPPEANDAPIDLVISFLNPNDPRLIEDLRLSKAPTVFDIISDEEDLRIILRSVDLYGQLFRTIYFIVPTQSQIPKWVNTTGSERFKVIDLSKILFHGEILGNAQHGHSTANPYAIQAVLHTVPNISETFVYVDSNVIFTNPVTIDDFLRFSADGAKKITGFKFRSDHIKLPIDSPDIDESNQDTLWTSSAMRSRDAANQACGFTRPGFMKGKSFVPRPVPHVLSLPVLKRMHSLGIFNETIAQPLLTGNELNAVMFSIMYSTCKLHQPQADTEDDSACLNIDRKTRKVKRTEMRKLRKFYKLRVPVGDLKFLCFRWKDSNSTEDAAKETNTMIDPFLWRQGLFTEKSAFEI